MPGFTTNSQQKLTKVAAFSDRQERIYNFLHEHPVGVLSTIDPNGEPHGTVIYFMIDEQFNITFLTRAETKKHDNLNHFNHATLTVFEVDAQTSVQVVGKAEEITDRYEVNRIAGEMLAVSMRISQAGLPPITKLQAGPFVAFQIEPVQIRMAVYSRPDPGNYEELFESLESFDLINDR